MKWLVKWKLKKYLRLRGLKVTGIKAELVAKVFVASKAFKTAAEIVSDLQTEYQAKLLHGETLPPDPHYLTSGWFAEDEGFLAGHC